MLVFSKGTIIEKNHVTLREPTFWELVRSNLKEICVNKLEISIVVFDQSRKTKKIIKV